MTDIAHGQIKIDLNDADVVAGLRKVDSEFGRTMDDIGRRRAVAEIDAELRPFERKVETAKKRLKELQGQRAEVTLEADAKRLDEQILVAKRAVASLDGQKATVELRLQGQREFLRGLSDADAMARRLEDTAERAGRAQQKRQYQQEVGSRKEVTRILELQKQYARLTDKLEYLDKKKPIGREARAKVELDATGVVAKMELLKAELNALGAHPPVDIKADINQKGLKRITQGFSGFITTLANKASGLQDLSVRMGPFTTSLRGLGLALGFLGPTITDLLGAAGSLVGVLGAGISGAATIGAGALTGLAGDFLGLKFATRNTGQELAQARTSINAYQSAVLKYGKGSDKAIAKQKEMNTVLRQISPLAREAAKGTETFFNAWDKSTKPTQGSLGTIAKEGFQALNSLRPMWARSTNEMSAELQKGLSGAFKFLERPSTSNQLGGILHNINAQIPTLLHGLGSLGQAFLNIASQGAANFGTLAHGFDNFATSILRFTQQDSFGATVRRWVTYASDVMHFFGAAGRVLVHFFGDGSKAGDGFINTMTKAMNRWDRFITSAGGKNKIGDFFQHSVKGAEALYSAFKPIIQLFTLWSVGLEPAVTVITQIFAGLTNAAAALGKFVGLGNPLKTMGATFGALFAVSKIGSFVSMLARASSLLNDIRKAEGVGGVLKSIGSGGFLSQLGSGRGGIAAAGSAAAGEMRSAIISGGTVAAGEMRAAITEGGALAGAEEAAGAAGGSGLLGTAKKLILPASAAAESAGAAEVAGTAVAGIGVAAGAATLGVAALAAGLIYLGIKTKGHVSEVDKANAALRANETALRNDAGYTTQAATAQDTAAAAHRRAATSIAQLKKELAGATKGSVQHEEILIRLVKAQTNAKAQTDKAVAAAKDQSRAAKSTITDEQKQIDLINRRKDAQKKDISGRSLGSPGMPGYYAGDKGDPRKLAQIDAQATAEIAAHQRAIQAAYNLRAAAALNVARAERGMQALSGRAAQQVGALARQQPKMAQTISLKYQNPTNAGNVAAQAKAALGAGVKIKTVMQIVADSKNAEAAIRRLTALKLAKKMQEIGITGDNGVLSKMTAIQRKTFNAKVQRILDQGGDPTMAKILAIANSVIRDKRFSINAQADQAIANAGIILARLAAMHDKTVTLTTNEVHNIVTRMKNYPHASGLRAGSMSTHDALIGEGAAPEYHVNTATGAAYRTVGPTFAKLGPNDAIIPTEPRYRQNARGIMADIAQSLGMNMYKKGKGVKKHPKVDKSQYLRLDPSDIDTRAQNADTKLSQDRSKAKETSGSGKNKKRTHAARDASKRLPQEREDAMYWDRMRKRADAFATRLSRLQENADTAATRMNTANDQGKEAEWVKQQKLRKGWLDKARVALRDEQKAAPKGTKWAADIDNALAQIDGDINSNKTAEMSAPDAPTTFTKDEQGRLDQLNAALALDQLTDDNNVDDAADTKKMIDFLSGILSGMQKDPAQFLGRGGYPAVTEVAGLLKSAQDSYKAFTAPPDTTPDLQAQLDQANERARVASASSALSESALSAFTGSGDIGSGGSSAYAAVRSDGGGNVLGPPQEVPTLGRSVTSAAQSDWTTRSGAPAASGGAAPVTIQINTLHPGDPATLRAVGDAATAGVGYQGFRDAPRTSVGY